MSQDITLLGASYSAVPAVRLPKTGGGTADFTDVSDTTAAAADVASGKYFYTSAGVRTQGTSSGGGGGSGLTLLQTTSIGALSTSSTSAADTGKTISLAQATGWQNYDLLIVDISVDTTTNGRHTSTVSFVILTGTSNVSTKNTYTVRIVMDKLYFLFDSSLIKVGAANMDITDCIDTKYSHVFGILFDDQVKIRVHC